MEQKKLQIKVITTLSFFFLVVLMLVFAFLRGKEIRKSGCWTEAIIIRVDYKNIKYRYIVGGKTFFGLVSKSRFRHCEIGEKFKVYYNKKSPSEEEISFYEPCFNNFDFGQIKSNPVSKNYNKGRVLITFSFQFNNKRIDRKHFTILSSEISEGDVLNVYYYPENPRISYVTH